MSDRSAAVAEVETRQAMVRVWMAISAIWTTFWISIAVLFVLTGVTANPFASQLRLFALIVLSPPLVLLVAGALFRFAFAALFRRSAPA